MKTDEIKLQNGTLIRHRVVGYEGRIDGTTEIAGCFTVGGEPLAKSTTKETFQYRVVVEGEAMRRIAPPDDLEILEEVTGITCPHCRFSFQSRPGCVNKPGGRCQCGGWICPACSACQDPTQSPPCARQLKHLSRKPSRKTPGRLTQ